MTDYIVIIKATSPNESNLCLYKVNADNKRKAKAKALIRLFKDYNYRGIKRFRIKRVREV